MPRGFYKDETSIAYNAWLIATTGRDEFGVAWPMYIESFGDYKNAGYVYLSVVVMRIFGLSLWTVRLPSVLCWAVGSSMVREELSLHRKSAVPHVLRAAWGDRVEHTAE